MCQSVLPRLQDGSASSFHCLARRKLHWVCTRFDRASSENAICIPLLGSSITSSYLTPLRSIFDMSRPESSLAVNKVIIKLSNFCLPEEAFLQRPSRLPGLRPEQVGTCPNCNATDRRQTFASSASATSLKVFASSKELCRASLTGACPAACTFCCNLGSTALQEELLRELFARFNPQLTFDC